MKLPVIPLPEPSFTITLTRGSDRSRRAMANALRFLLWVTPAAGAEYALAVTAAGRHAPWLSLTVTCVVLMLAVLTVNVDSGGDAP